MLGGLCEEDRDHSTLLKAFILTPGDSIYTWRRRDLTNLIRLSTGNIHYEMQTRKSWNNQEGFMMNSHEAKTVRRN